MIEVFELNSKLQSALTQCGLNFAGVFDFSFLYTHSSSPLKTDFEALKNWVDKRWNADMHFMSQNFEARKDARLLLPEVKSAITLLVPYAVGKKSRGSRVSVANISHDLKNKKSEFLSKTAKYAHGKDYHKVLKRVGLNAISVLKQEIPENFEARIIVDSVPFFERAHAAQSGMGFVGKNTMLIRPGIGSLFFIATILTTLDTNLIAQKSKQNAISSLNCGDCRRCIDACPTNAINDYFVDANKCLSYHSIENRDIVSDSILPHFKNHFFGCDICQDVCPYNYSTTDMLQIKDLVSAHAPFQTISFEQIAQMSQLEYEKIFGGTSLTRAKYGGLVRNALYVLYANHSSSLSKILEIRAQDENKLIRKTVAQLLRLENF